MDYKKIAPIAAVMLGLAASHAAAQDRDPADIAGVIASHTPEIAAIYDTYLDAGLALEGTVVVKFTIARTGVVTAEVGLRRRRRRRGHYPVPLHVFPPRFPRRRLKRVRYYPPIDYDIRPPREVRLYYKKPGKRYPFHN